MTKLMDIYEKNRGQTNSFATRFCEFCNWPCNRALVFAQKWEPPMNADVNMTDCNFALIDVRRWFPIT